MQFVFKRDEEGRESVYVNDEHVANLKSEGGEVYPMTVVPGIDGDDMAEAIERADEAGFWDDPMHNSHKYNRTIVGGMLGTFRVSEVTVDVPVADNAVLSVTVGGDES